MLRLKASASLVAALCTGARLRALRLHKKHASQGPLWHHQFWGRFVRSSQELNDQLEYMHLNPIRKGLVEQSQQ